MEWNTDADDPLGNLTLHADRPQVFGDPGRPHAIKQHDPDRAALSHQIKRGEERS